MNWLWIMGILAAIAGAFTALMRQYKMGPFLDMPSMDRLITPAPEPPKQPPVVPLSFKIPKEAYHATRVLCDQNRLSFDEKNTICACIYQESEFYNYLPNGKPVSNANIVNGHVASTDWGIVQINDYYHIGPHKDFPTVQYALDNPEQTVNWMIHMYKVGLLKQWVSYSSGAYKRWLRSDSPMWLLAQS